MPIGISGLAILLYVREVTGSFAAAGTCTGALALGSALGRAAAGPRWSTGAASACWCRSRPSHAAGLLAVWARGRGRRAGRRCSRCSSLLTGAAIPPVSSVLRSRWPYLLAERPELMAGAFALDSVLIEVVFVVGPLLTTVVVATVGPQYALIVSAACVLTGTLAAAQPVCAGRPGPSRPARPARRFGLGALADPGLRTLVFASLPVGFALGSIEVALPAFSEAEGSKALAGVLLAVWSVGSGVAGPGLGRARRRASAARARTCASPGCCRSRSPRSRSPPRR